MEYGIGSNLPGRARFEDSGGVGMDGLTVHVDVLAPDGTLADTALVATGLGHSSGLYDLVWTGENAAGAEALGGYTLVFKVISGGSPAKTEQCSHFLVVPWVVAGKILVGSIASGAITASAIASNALTSAKIAADAITPTQIQDGALTAAKFAGGALTAMAAAIWDLANGIETGETPRQWARLIRSKLAGKTTDAGGGATAFYRKDGTTVACTDTVNSTTNLRTTIVVGDLT